MTVDDTGNNDGWQRNSVCDLREERACAAESWRLDTISSEAVYDDCGDGVEGDVEDLEDEKGLPFVSNGRMETHIPQTFQKSWGFLISENKVKKATCPAVDISTLPATLQGIVSPYAKMMLVTAPNPS